ncbi:unnamed protein product [Spirodela intermedia]|uniref:Uncharacterized protein n=2 Tax=Spirodela intermedia TaxID=51605 RepID=A0A7I8L7Y3_SPIIN|nr:unnamed protein product [Spirodela intermedia]CAA6669204.1 unnamed protein product [Spirodela intermedia]CAA7406151.1 unnamed protein product [Spirodela intermedia]
MLTPSCSPFKTTDRTCSSQTTPLLQRGRERKRRREREREETTRRRR